VVDAVTALEADPRLRHRWQARFSQLCVEEFQDVDAAQLRLVRLLAAPDRNGLKSAVPGRSMTST
jgi:superfamily I DNA/RNA helicase